MKTIDFEFGGTRHSLALPEGAYCEICAADIIEGRSYPFPDFINDPEVIVDIGGHVGEFAALAKLAWPTATVHCFEPNPAVEAILRRNAGAFGFIVHMQGVAAQGGRRTLRFSTFGTVAATLLERDHWTGRAIGVDVIEPKEIAALKPDVLKIDAEGVEVEIMERLPLAGIGMIHVEFHYPQHRLQIDQMLLDTHDLWFCRMSNKDQGEMTYIRKKWDGKEC